MPEPAKKGRPAGPVPATGPAQATASTEPSPGQPSPVAASTQPTPPAQPGPAAASTQPTPPASSLPLPAPKMRPLSPDFAATAAQPVLKKVFELVQSFCEQPPSPTGAHQFEEQLQERLRQVGQVLTQAAYNHLEPADVEELPKHVHFECLDYTRDNPKTPQDVWTLFGKIRLRRARYRPSPRTGDAAIFPLAIALGLIQGVSPALADRTARLLAQTGATQSQVLARLRQDHGIRLGVGKLRNLGLAVAGRLVEQRETAQVELIWAWMNKAQKSRGRHKPGLSVGRDGVTMPIRAKGGKVPEVASVGTLSVLDRQGQRLGTVYLGCAPEPLQKTMTTQLTSLIRAVLLGWEGCEFRLSYVSDCGENESTYYQDMLVGMTHPRTGAALEWVRVVDFYHASKRVWDMAKLLDGDSPAAKGWARKMLSWFKTDEGVKRVLHSAAALRAAVGLTGKSLSDFETAYAYLRDRMDHLRYAQYARLGVPLGSGVTEAACKTVVTQRLKLSGMTWEKPGAKIILSLRVLLVSGVWDQAYGRLLRDVSEPTVLAQGSAEATPCKKAG